MVSIPFLSSSANPEAPTADGRDSAHTEDRPKMSHKSLDIVFLQDTTGSQGPYIRAARQAIRDICDKISACAQFPKDSDLIRFGLIAFRDHPPQDLSYITKEFGFTSNIEIMQKNLTSLIATGGGDGPEAQTAALAAALNLEWKEDAIKVAVLITDSGPHGLGEFGDGFDKSPDQNDPLDMARQMAERGITLFVVACEPTLSNSMNALDFYSALVQITGGRLLPLLMADKLGDYIVASAVETIETEQLISEFEHVIIDDVYAKSKPIEEVMTEVHQQLQNRGTQLQTMELENVYQESEQATKNREIWFGATSIAEARLQVKRIGGMRLKPEFVGSLPFNINPPRSMIVDPLILASMERSAHGGPVRQPKRRGPAQPTGMAGQRHSKRRAPSQEEDWERPRFGDRERERERDMSTSISADSDIIVDGDEVEEGAGEEARNLAERQKMIQEQQMRLRQMQMQQQVQQQQMQQQQMQQGMPQMGQQQMQRAMMLAQQQAQRGMAQMAQQQMQQVMPQQPVQQQQQQPKLTLERANVNMSQAHRLVMQSLTRNSKVTATGLISKKGETAGQQVSIGPYKEM